MDVKMTRIRFLRSFSSFLNQFVVRNLVLKHYFHSRQKKSDDTLEILGILYDAVEAILNV